MICESQNKNGSKWIIQSLSLILPVFNSHFPRILECLWLYESLNVYDTPSQQRGCTFANKNINKFSGHTNFGKKNKRKKKKTDWVGSFQVKKTANRTKLGCQNRPIPQDLVIFEPHLTPIHPPVIQAQLLPWLKWNTPKTNRWTLKNDRSKGPKACRFFYR